MSPTFNKSEIMRRAWAIVKKGSDWQKYRLRRLRYALQDAWSEAKRAVKVASQTATDIVRQALFVLDCQSHWSQADYAKSDLLRAELRALSGGAV